MESGTADEVVAPEPTRRVAPLPWWFHVVLVAGAAALLWGTSTPMMIRSWLAVGGLVVMLAALGWLVEVVALVRARQWSKGVLVLPVVMVVVAVALGIEAPLRLRWGATFHDPFERLTETVQPDDAPMVVGGLTVTEIERFGNDIVFHLQSEGVVKEGGIAFSREGVESLIDRSGHSFTFRDLDDHWYIWSDD